MESLKLFELKKIQTEFPNVKISSSEKAYEFIKKFYGDDIAIFESFFILLLNNANMTIGYAKISQGGITTTVVDVRLIAKYAVESLATTIIVAHNHPSGKLIPSQADIDMTKKIKNAISVLDINIMDHIILTENSFYSFADNQLI
jgi:DNA repair protein RadC